MRVSACPLCGREDAIAAKDEPRFYVAGRLTAICFHGHDGQGPVVFDAETGAAVRMAPLQPHELLYRAAEADGARGFGAAFLAEHCGIYALSLEAIRRVQPSIPSEKDWVRAQQQDGTLTVAPLYHGAEMVGLEVRIVETKDIGKVAKWTRVLGERAVYIANPSLNPEVVVLLEGTWDVVAAAWDALQADEPHRYAFCAISSGTSVDVVEQTLKAHFPGVPVLILTDQDGPGKGARQKLARLGTLACLKGCGLVKDYREAAPKARREALLEAIENALNAPPPGEEFGVAKIARRALEGALKAKRKGLRDLEAWRFGQRCAGICRCFSGSKRYYSIRARIDGGLPMAEGQFDFATLLNHRMARQIREDYPDLAAVLDGGATESPVAQAWLPPQFLEDGRHWTEIPEASRKAFARERGWEPWTGKDPGAPQASDLSTLREQLLLAYRYVRIPEVPDSEVGDRVLVFCLAMALSALWAEERWMAHKPLGFLPWEWFYGGDTTGKGTAAKVIAMMVSGSPRTYGSQRFDGASSGWLTESVLYLCLCFRDELDEFLSHSDLEDLKTNLAGDPLQIRKKFEAGITIAPKPLVFSTNNLKINESDEATKSRVVVINLTANPLSTREQRSAAFDGFYRWVEGPGQDLIYRVGIALYRDFRAVPIPKARWTRSAVFDAAMSFACGKFRIDPAAVMQAASDVKETCIREGLPWYQALLDYVHHELGQAQCYHEARLVQVLGIDPSNESQARKLRRWFGEMEKALANGPLCLSGWQIQLGPYSTTTTRVLRFSTASGELNANSGDFGHLDTTRNTREEEFSLSQMTDNGF